MCSTPVAIELLCPQAPIPVTPQLVKEMFHIEMSEKGSNRNLTEQRVIGYWRDFVEDLAGMF